MNCDDYGRLDGRVAIVRAKLFPLKVDTIKERDIERWITRLIDAELILIYQNEDKHYIQIITWELHQSIRNQKSKYPDPNESVCMQLNTVAHGCSRNPIQSESNLESESNPILRERFEKLWAVYPKKKSKGDALKAWLVIKPSEQLLAEMLTALERAKTSVDWTKDKGLFIPYPATWLRRECWLDEQGVDKPPPNKSKFAEIYQS